MPDIVMEQKSAYDELTETVRALWSLALSSEADYATALWKQANEIIRRLQSA